MKRLVFAVALGILSSAFSFGQVTITGSDPIRTGFAVVTPLLGGGAGLTVSETFGVRLGGNFVQTSIQPSPLITLTQLLIRFDGNSGVNTAVAIVNPNAGSAVVSLGLRDQRGVPVVSATITIGGRQQLSRFATELFSGLPGVSAPFEGLLSLSSNVPVGVLGITFDGASFTSLPVATQLNSTRVIGPTSTAIGVGSILLSQIVAGGGWESRITVANTSTVAQVFRIDFFSSQGGPLTLPIGSSVPSVTVPAGGVVTFSTTG